MTPVVMLSTVAAITIFLALRMCRRSIAAGSAMAGTVSTLSGAVTTLLMTAHLGSTWLQIVAAQPAPAEFEQFALLALGVAIFIPGLLCVSLAGAVTRGELHAQKRTLAAAVIILGLTLPLSLLQPLATVMAVLALANLATLLSSRTNLKLSELAM